MHPKKKRRFLLTPPRVLALGFVALILFGGLLLSLPVCSRDGAGVPFFDALFTATSATCVTGLAVVDTYTQFSFLGHLVLLCLIQVGGLGFMTFITFISMVIHGKLGLSSRLFLLESGDGVSYAGMKPLLWRIVLGSFCIELVGAALLSLRFVPRFGFLRGIWFSLFHAISAFCNAGFDLMGYASESSFIGFGGDVLVLCTLSLLIVIGGIGFFVWQDVLKHKHHFSKYTLHSKLVLMTTGVLLSGATLLFLLSEWNASMRDLSFGEKLLSAFFQSVTTRTAGFAALDQSTLSGGGTVLTVLLMLVGGSPGSTAGGIKTTVLVAFLASAFATVRGNDGVVLYKRRLASDAPRHAAAVIAVYGALTVTAVFLLSLWEPYRLSFLLFETASALGTVGLSMSLTPLLGAPSKIVLMLLMYIGRVGALSLLVAFAKQRECSPLERPQEKIIM